MRVTFRLSALGFGGSEQVFLSVANYLMTTYGWSIDFVVDRVNGGVTEHVAAAKGYHLVDLGASRTWKSIFPFRRYLIERKPDIVISAYTETNAAALIANAFCLRTSIIVTEHASLDEHWAHKPWLRRIMLEFMVRYIYKLADHVMCVSRGMAEQLATRLKHRDVSYIHNPVRFALRTKTKAAARHLLGMKHETRIILAVGRISRPKNYLMLLQAFKTLSPSSAYHLYIVGGVFEQSEKTTLDRFIAVHDLAALVTFVDFTHEVHTYYEAADLFVLSSAWEGFGNVIVEALSFGLPVVSTNCNFGPAEILLDNQFGILVNVNDSIAMGHAIQEVLENNPFEPARQIMRASNFSEQNIGNAYYRQIIETMNSRNE